MEILDVAKSLSEDDAEARLRSSVSRAYYAALHRVDLALPQKFGVKDGQRKGGSSHDAVIQALTAWGKSITPGRQNARFAAQTLPRLKAARIRADYYLAETISKVDAEEALRYAATIFELMDRAVSSGDVAKA